MPKLLKTLLYNQHLFLMDQIKMEMSIDTDEDNRDEYSTREQPEQKFFCDCYGFDERDGPQEDTEEGGSM